MWRKHNENPKGRNVGDCTVRAISAATGDGWEKTYCGLIVQGYVLRDMPSANAVWGAYLRKKGFTRRFLPDECPECYTVQDFCREHPNGIYILALSGHVICVKDGCYLDTWDSGQELPIYYWERKDEQ